MPTSEYLLGRRSDLSGYLIHLTRDYDDISPRKNLKSILRKGCVEARNAYCLFMRGMNSLPPAETELFKVVCFTETPLSELNYMVQTMEGRSTALSPYGLVFKKEVVRARGGNPVFYIDTRSEDGKERCEYLWSCFREAKKNGFKSEGASSLLPLINKVSNQIDFSWEREWRIAGNFNFKFNEVFLGLCPKNRLEDFEDEFPGIVWVSPRWGRDQIISKLRQLAVSE
ncbi:MAG: hypothetical protein KA426_01215 [Nitrospira sp.]|nr:hypothetical protein [Nitrospira sp.]HQY58260.1 abortive infection system antitoxin AbiGi family protein [Nitrospira sp.]